MYPCQNGVVGWVSGGCVIMILGKPSVRKADQTLSAGEERGLSQYVPFETTHFKTSLDSERETSQECKRLPQKHPIGSQGVKLLLPKIFCPYFFYIFYLDW